VKRIVAVIAIVIVALPLFAADGAAVYKEKKCADCHGTDGSKAIPEKGVKPINTPATTGKSEEQLVALLAKANPKFTSEEVKSLAQFVKSFK
jgi:mono/diheme cytochrome c family protein